MKTIFFDFFGVLSTPVYMQVIKDFIPEKEQPKWVKKLDLLDNGDISEDYLVKEISEQSGISENKIWSTVFQAPKLNLKLIDFIKNNLKKLYTIGLLTNAPRSLVERILQKELSLFDVVVISSDIKIIKPNPKIFKYTLYQAKVASEEILFIDDSEKNIQVAKSFGIQGIVYKDFDSFVNEIDKYLLRR